MHNYTDRAQVFNCLLNAAAETVRRSEEGGAENAGQDIAVQDNDGQEKHHA